jgi:flavin reductase (DIM6/NTAB) family NADH-FMN oxidoreductase RutF
MTIGPIPLGQDPEHYDRLRRRVLWSMPTGLYVIGSARQRDQRYNLMTANLVVQVCVEPKLVAAAIEATSLTAELVSESGAFAVSFIAPSDRAVVRRFVKPAVDVEFDEHATVRAISGESVTTASTGAPVLSRAVAWLDCALRDRLELGSHVLFVGEVVDAFGPEGDHQTGVLAMHDTRMNYGG